jgi:hypothetical protein
MMSAHDAAPSRSKGHARSEVGSYWKERWRQAALYRGKTHNLVTRRAALEPRVAYRVRGRLMIL